jgi:hypothetical protein
MLVAAASFFQALQLEPKQWLDLKRFDPKQTQDISLFDLSIHKNSASSQTVLMATVS